MAESQMRLYSKQSLCYKISSNTFLKIEKPEVLQEIQTERRQELLGEQSRYMHFSFGGVQTYG